MVIIIMIVCITRCEVTKIAPAQKVAKRMQEKAMCTSRPLNTRD